MLTGGAPGSEHGHRQAESFHAVDSIDQPVESFMRHFCCIVLPLAMLGCSSAKSGDGVSAPLACSLTPEELRNRRDALLPGLIHRAEKVTDLDNGLRLEFKNKDGLLAEIAKIMEQERACCTFLRFQLIAEPEGGMITFDVTGPKGTREVLRSF